MNKKERYEIRISKVKFYEKLTPAKPLMSYDPSLLDFYFTTETEEEVTEIVSTSETSARSRASKIAEKYVEDKGLTISTGTGSKTKWYTEKGSPKRYFMLFTGYNTQMEAVRIILDYIYEDETPAPAPTPEPITMTVTQLSLF